MLIGGGGNAMDKLISLEDAVGKIESGQTIALGGMTNYRRPMGAVWELIRQSWDYDNEKNRVTDLTLLGLTLGIESDLLIAAGMVSTVRTCYFGLEHLPAPMYMKAAAEGTIEIIEETEGSIAYGLRAALAGLSSLAGPGWLGTDMLELRPDVSTITDPYDGTTRVAFPALKPDVALIHVEKADALGNAVVSGNRAIDREIAALADYTILTAEQIVSTEEIAKDGAYISSEMVDAVVELPMGAFPTSCYPFYTFHVGFLQEWIKQFVSLTQENFIDDYFRDLESHAEFLEEFNAEEYRNMDPRKLFTITGKKKGGKPTRAEIMAKAIADCIPDDITVAQGIATPMVLAGYRLAKLTHAPNLRFASAIGNCLTEEGPPLSILGEEFANLDNALALFGFVEAACEYLPFSQPLEFLRPVQVDRQGNTNNLETTHAKSGDKIRWPGSGGIPDVSTYNPNLFLYIPRQKDYTLVEKVEIVSGVGHGDRRKEHGLSGSGPQKLITDLAVYTFENGQLELESIHPGVKDKDIKKNTGFDIEIPEDLPTTPLPSEEELRILREEVDPHGVSELELMGGLKRLLKLLSIASKEKKIMQGK